MPTGMPAFLRLFASRVVSVPCALPSFHIATFHSHSFSFPPVCSCMSVRSGTHTQSDKRHTNSQIHVRALPTCTHPHPHAFELISNFKNLVFQTGVTIHLLTNWPVSAPLLFVFRSYFSLSSPLSFVVATPSHSFWPLSLPNPLYTCCHSSFTLTLSLSVPPSLYHIRLKLGAN
jgi:hypothetical protein